VTPLSGGGVGAADAVAFGDEHVGVVQESVDERGRDAGFRWLVGIVVLETEPEEE
jgi:hypothetical protein